MKKLLILLAFFAVTTPATLSVVACGTGDSDNTDNTVVNANVKTWSKESSNLVKSLILGKNENLNTNRILDTVLQGNKSHIINESSTQTGASFAEFSRAWGYQGTITNVNASDFKSDADNTIDNQQINQEQKITNIIKNIPDYLSKIPGILKIVESLGIDPINMFSNNQEFSKIINSPGMRAVMDGLIWPKVKQYFPLPSQINGIYQNWVQPLVKSLNNSLTAINPFNPETALGDYYSPDIPTALFGSDGSNGWLANYQPNGQPLDAVSKNSTILQGDNRNLFTNWDQVSLFKTGADFNSAIKYILTQAKETKITSLSDLFQSALTFDDNGNATNFDQNAFGAGLTTIFSALTSDATHLSNNIATLLPSLIALVKYEILGFVPTAAVATISDDQPTSQKDGIINLNELLTTISNIILTKDGFTNFISDIFCKPSDATYSDHNFLTFDITLDTKTAQNNDQALSTVINDTIKNQITASLGAIYDQYVAPTMTNGKASEIISIIQKHFNNLADSTKFDININTLTTLTNMLASDSVKNFLEVLTKIKNQDDFEKQWSNLFMALGMQDQDQTEFADGSLLAIVQPLIKQFNNTDELAKALQALFKPFTNLLNLANDITTDTFDTLIHDEITNDIDFNNESVWTIDESSIAISYDKANNTSEIAYQLTYQQKPYQVTIVVQGNAQDELTGNKQVWIKSLQGL